MDWTSMWNKIEGGRRNLVYNDQTIMVRLNIQEEKNWQHNINLYVIHPWYNKGNLNPLGVIQIPYLGLTPKTTNCGKITTRDSLV